MCVVVVPLYWSVRQLAPSEIHEWTTKLGPLGTKQSLVNVLKGHIGCNLVSKGGTHTYKSKIEFQGLGNHILSEACTPL